MKNTLSVSLIEMGLVIILRRMHLLVVDYGSASEVVECVEEGIIFIFIHLKDFQKKNHPGFEK